MDFILGILFWEDRLLNGGYFIGFGRYSVLGR